MRCSLSLSLSLALGEVMSTLKCPIVRYLSSNRTASLDPWLPDIWYQLAPNALYNINVCVCALHMMVHKYQHINIICKWKIYTCAQFATVSLLPYCSEWTRRLGITSRFLSPCLLTVPALKCGWLHGTNARSFQFPSSAKHGVACAMDLVARPTMPMLCWWHVTAVWRSVTANWCSLQWPMLKNNWIPQAFTHACIN